MASFAVMNITVQLLACRERDGIVSGRGLPSLRASQTLTCKAAARSGEIMGRPRQHAAESAETARAMTAGSAVQRRREHSVRDGFIAVFLHGMSPAQHQQTQTPHTAPPSHSPALSRPRPLTPPALSRPRPLRLSSQRGNLNPPLAFIKEIIMVFDTSITALKRRDENLTNLPRVALSTSCTFNM
ncbi:hypothetical protein SKAU_G00184570 [Synaphobranchus kaupii]|uniref:Uncharacterized protein n=1 Tax=Synaphobranchus kaupii TaxID=118154 RepID=A0A9Q1FCU7_SYNKA|nr:hypothetical protein SKAU_G00184570 [Synaphobranchus kaupii]